MPQRNYVRYVPIYILHPRSTFYIKVLHPTQSDKIMNRPLVQIIRRLPQPSRLSHTDAYTVYHNPRRLRSASMTALSISQASFWAGASYLSQQVAEPLISPTWTVAGFGLSAAFSAMIAAYLRRNVVNISLVNGPAVRVTAHNFAGIINQPIDIPASHIVAGPHKDSSKERFWTFGVRGASGRVFYYIVDTQRGVIDRDAIGAIARGGDHLMAYSHKRDAGLMQTRWNQWQQTKLDPR